MTSPVRVRMAPSPTGLFHIGSARTALFNYLFARHHGGQFLLRIEDTDRERSESVYEKDILAAMRWLGLDWDEGPEVGGGAGPYHQTERLALYPPIAKQLLDSGQAYQCFCTREELEAERESQRAAHEPPRYSGRCCHLSANEALARKAEGREPVIRFKIPGARVGYFDLIRGEIETDTALSGDFVIQKADGMPMYNFANVVDDHLMAITHVIRGEDHISNTPKQIMLYEAMGWTPPEFAHLPLILNQDRSKMSKRSGPTAVADYRESGYLPEAVINFLVLLGWAPSNDEEMFTLDRLIADFTLDRVQSSPAVFNLDKLNWFNGQYIRALDTKKLLDLVRPHLVWQLRDALPVEQADLDAKLEPILPLIQERLVTLSAVGELAGFFFLDGLAYDQAELLPKKREANETAVALGHLHAQLSGLERWTTERIEQVLRRAVEELGWTVGELFMLVRLSVTGKKATPPLFETMAVLGQTVSLERLAAAQIFLDPA